MYKTFKRKGLSEMTTVKEFLASSGNLSTVSISDADKALTKEVFEQGMVAHNKKNHNDLRYVSKKYFDDNLEEFVPQGISGSVLDTASKLYNAYTEGVGGIAFNGDKLPTAEVFFADKSKEKQINGWLAAANSVMTPVNNTSVAATTETFEDRLNNELKELSEKIYKLDSFVLSDKFKDINEHQQSLLRTQLAIMVKYKGILTDRIEHLKTNN